jgi:DNA-directed RNA polymerase subunit RPC12/RpoP|nr:MAG TPA: Rubredoxin loop, ELECTRON TRANSPORT [Caudoviricetes sp.]
MCAECRQIPCDPRCPNAPDPDPDYICDRCGEPVYDNLYYEMDNGGRECPNCNERRERWI